MRKDKTSELNAREYAENLSHELLTPLAIIRSKAELLLQSSHLDKQDLQHIDVILKTVQRMSRLNQALIILSKIENNLFVDEEALDMKEVVADSLEKFEDQIRQRSLSVRFAKVSENHSLRSNPNLMEILVSNLIKNAVFHNVDKGYIHISLSDSTLSIENATSGKALPRNHFDRFVSGENKSGSHGLGLAIVQQICNQLHYTIETAIADRQYSTSIHFKNNP
ncbi:MAG: HAMP domain-containing sensor histidine kinase [Crocinitomicaceae bacterium]